MMALRPSELQKLSAILGRLGSDFAGERDAAALAASRFLRDRKLVWDQVLGAGAVVTATEPVQRYWKDTAEQILARHARALTDWELEFIQDLLRRGRAPSPRQEAKLRDIAAKTGVPAW